MDQRTINHQIHDTFLSDVITGLSQTDKRLSCKYFYDETGSQLFDQICELDEYYLTRTEQAIMDSHAAEMAACIGEGALLVEFGSGSSTKTDVLLKNLIHPSAYVPLDISQDHLLKTADSLRKRFPQIEVLPVVADFTESFSLPKPKVEPSRFAVYFPGSTIGNFVPTEVERLLANIVTIFERGVGLLIGIDLQKDPSIIHAAYNDAAGVTAEFNLNILNRINSELDANFDIAQFEHLAFYDQVFGRIELYLVSRCDQSVQIGAKTFEFTEGERIFTEYSHKYSVEGFTRLAKAAKFNLRQTWTDPNRLFAVLYLVQDGSD